MTTNPEPCPDPLNVEKIREWLNITSRESELGRRQPRDFDDALNNARDLANEIDRLRAERDRYRDDWIKLSRYERGLQRDLTAAEDALDQMRAAQ